MAVTAIIPARFSSTRLEGKPLVDIAGKPMIQRVWQAAVEAKTINNVIIATDDQRIKDEVESFGGDAVLTPEKLSSGTDRIAHVVYQIYPSDRPAWVVNVQGDEPLITGEIIDQLVVFAIRSDSRITTIVTKCDKIGEEDCNVVKVVMDKNNYALYFSRSSIPYCKDSTREFFKHIGIYAFKTDALLDFSQMKPGELEKTEKLEQLRALENGWKIKCVNIPQAKNLIGVDTPEDLEKVRDYLK